MIQLPYPRMLEIIQEKSQLSRQEIEEKIEQKMSDFSGLISKEGAAHVIANELSIDLFSANKKPITISQLQPGLKDISVHGKVLKKYNIVEFHKEKTTGKVASLLIGDQTGQVRITFWHQDVEQQQKLNEGDCLFFEHVSSKLNQGSIELFFGTSSKISPSEQQIETTVSSTQNSPANKRIAQLQPQNSPVSIIGYVVQINKINYYIVDKKTQKSMKPEVFDENEHAHAFVASALIDDGTQVIRAVFFREQATQFFHCDVDKILNWKNDSTQFESEKNALLGKLVLLQGRVSKNELYDRLEFLVQTIQTDISAEQYEAFVRKTQ